MVLHLLDVAEGNTVDPLIARIQESSATAPEKIADFFRYSSQHGIDRSRLILNWAGEATAIVPVNGSNAANRRVEFRVAKGETEMARPEGKEAGKGSFKGNKDAGF